jgi:hypothetical protein
MPPQAHSCGHAIFAADAHAGFRSQTPTRDCHRVVGEALVVATDQRGVTAGSPSGRTILGEQNLEDLVTQSVHLVAAWATGRRTGALLLDRCLGALRQVGGKHTQAPNLSQCPGAEIGEPGFEQPQLVHSCLHTKL